jgi:hypothetical protein
MEVISLKFDKLLQEDSYNNPLDFAHFVKMYAALKEAFEIAAEGGIGGSKWGDQNEAEAISLLMSNIWKKYQDHMTLEERQIAQEAATKVMKEFWFT